jgi:hypothetical protein
MSNAASMLTRQERAAGVWSQAYGGRSPVSSGVENKDKIIGATATASSRLGELGQAAT